MTYLVIAGGSEDKKRATWDGKLDHHGSHRYFAGCTIALTPSQDGSKMRD